jgi:eukaryotic-like serine/threonine-protein kinase
MLTTRSSAGLIGRTLKGRFALSSFHRQGATATIYHGADLRSGAEIAVKVPQATLASEPKVRARLEREGRVLLGLSHPNVVAAIDAGVVEGLAFVAMEFVRGENLRALLRERDRLPEQLAGTIVRDVCRGLGAAHAAGVVHRDVRPENVVVALAADETTASSVKLIDFSLAKLGNDEDDTTDGASPTLIGAEIGALTCLSPELGRGAPAGPPHDVYGAGALLFELLAGRPPFAGLAALDVLEQHVKSPPPPAPQVSPTFGAPPAPPLPSGIGSTVASPPTPMSHPEPRGSMPEHHAASSLASLERALQALAAEQRESGARLERRVVVLVAVVAAALLASVAALWSALG